MSCVNCIYENRITRVYKTHQEISLDKYEIACINQGYLICYKIDQNGNELIQAIIGPNQVFGYVKQDLFFKTISKVELFIITDPLLEEGSLLSTALTTKCLKCLGKTLYQQQVFKFSSSMSIKDKINEVNSVLLKQFGINGILPFHLTHQDYANIIGTTRESISRNI